MIDAGDQVRDQVEEVVEQAVVPRMFALTEVFVLAIGRLDRGTLVEQDFVQKGYWQVFEN